MWIYILLAVIIGIEVLCFVIYGIYTHFRKPINKPLPKDNVKEKTHNTPNPFNTAISIKRKETIYKKIDRIHGYYQNGSITQEEFETLKQQLLNKL